MINYDFMIKKFTGKIIYVDRRGNKFDSEELALEINRLLAKEDLMKKRNWFQRLFNELYN